MFSLTVLIIIQFFFCLFFFLYFRHKIIEQLKLKEYKQELEEVIIAFNRQAEQHISYLEKLLNQDVLKNNPTKNFNSNQFYREEVKQVKGYHPQFNSLTTQFSENPNGLSSLNPVPNGTHSFYAQLGEKKYAKTLFNREESVSIEKNHLTTLPISPLINRLESMEAKKHNLKNEIQERILSLYKKGMDNTQIAKRLSISTAEVKLTLKLKGKI